MVQVVCSYFVFQVSCISVVFRAVGWRIFSGVGCGVLLFLFLVMYDELFWLLSF